MNDGWIEGRFEGTYEGERIARARGIRRYSFRLTSATLGEAAPTDGPFPEASAAEAPETEAAPEIRQARVGDVQLRVPALGLERSDTSLFDVRIVDWRLSRGVEAKGRSHGCIQGTLRARLLPAPFEAEPVHDEPALETDDPDALHDLDHFDDLDGLDDLGGPLDPTPEARAPRRARARPEAARLRDSDGLRSRSVEVEAPDASRVVDRLRYLAALVLALGLALGLWGLCGGRLATTWLAAVATALTLRHVARHAIRASAGRQGLFALALIAAQTLHWLEPLAHGQSIACAAPTPWHVAGIGGAVVAAALLRGRATLLVTSLAWTACVCVWCGATNGACAGAVAAPSSELSGAATPRSPSPDIGPRTSPDGHWPVMPDLRASSSAAGGAASLGTPVGGHGGGADASGGPGAGRAASIEGGDLATLDLAAPGGATSVGFEGGRGASPDGFDAGSGGSPAPFDAAGASPGGFDAPLDTAGAASLPADASPRSAGGGASSTRGGWVAAEHRQASAGAVLISLEHANRVPASFFESGAERRVYVPTDAIFEPGAADIRATGGLQLGRVAALLDSAPARRTRLTVHTDIGRGLEAQQRLSERRAASVRGWLADRGHLDPARFEVVGVGAREPIVPPDGSYAAQQPNRRIEIELVE